MTSNTQVINIKEKKLTVFFFMITPVLILLENFYQNLKDVGDFVSIWNAIFGLTISVLLLVERRFHSPMHIVFISGLASFAMSVYMITSKWYTPNVTIMLAGYGLAAITLILGSVYILRGR